MSDSIWDMAPRSENGEKAGHQAPAQKRLPRFIRPPEKSIFVSENGPIFETFYNNGANPFFRINVLSKYNKNNE
jgi:hypothetical protein